MAAHDDPTEEYVRRLEDKVERLTAALKRFAPLTVDGCEQFAGEWYWIMHLPFVEGDTSKPKLVKQHELRGEELLDD